MSLLWCHIKERKCIISLWINLAKIKHMFEFSTSNPVSYVCLSFVVTSLSLSMSDVSMSVTVSILLSEYLCLNMSNYESVCP